MGFTDAFNYVLYDNPISQGCYNVTKLALQPIASTVSSLTVKPPEVHIINKVEPLWALSNSQGPYIKIAGISGAAATALAAYGAHKNYPKDRIAELKAICETANKMHYLHTLALIGVPLTKNPKISGSLLVVGTILFTGPCYYHAFTGENKFGKLAPLGGTILICGWLAMLF